MRKISIMCKYILLVFSILLISCSQVKQERETSKMVVLDKDNCMYSTVIDFQLSDVNRLSNNRINANEGFRRSGYDCEFILKSSIIDCKNVVINMKDSSKNIVKTESLIVSYNKDYVFNFGRCNVDLNLYKFK